MKPSRVLAGLSPPVCSSTSALLTCGVMLLVLQSLQHQQQWSQSHHPIYIYAVPGHAFSNFHDQHAQVVQVCAHLTMTCCSCLSLQRSIHACGSCTRLMVSGLQCESLHQCIEDVLWTAVQELMTTLTPMASASGRTCTTPCVHMHCTRQRHVTAQTFLWCLWITLLYLFLALSFDVPYACSVANSSFEGLLGTVVLCVALKTKELLLAFKTTVSATLD